jgi:hypothetical protein
VLVENVSKLINAPKNIILVDIIAVGHQAEQRYNIILIKVQITNTT